MTSDTGAAFDAEVRIDGRDIQPMVTWGTTPEEAVPVTSCVPGAAGASHATSSSVPLSAVTKSSRGASGAWIGVRSFSDRACSSADSLRTGRVARCTTNTVTPPLPWA